MKRGMGNVDKKEYIEREALKRDLIDNRNFYPAIVKCAIEKAPAADVAPVVHGHWKLRDDGSGTCSECGFTQKNVWDYDNWQNYCGVCGADMRLRKSD